MSRYQFWKGLSILTTIYLCTAPKAIQYHSLSHTIKRSEVDSIFSLLNNDRFAHNCEYSTSAHSKAFKRFKTSSSCHVVHMAALLQPKNTAIKTRSYLTQYITHTTTITSSPSFINMPFCKCTNVAKYNRAGATLTARRHPLQTTN